MRYRFEDPQGCALPKIARTVTKQPNPPVKADARKRDTQHNGFRVRAAYRERSVARCQRWGKCDRSKALLGDGG